MKRLTRAMQVALAGGVALTLASGAAYSDGRSAINIRNVQAACKKAADDETSPLRGTGTHTKMWCAIVNREGRLLSEKATDTGESPGPGLTSDAWRGSIEIAIAKAYTGVAFSSDDLALDSKTVGLLTRPDGPGSTLPADIGTNAGVAPLWGLGNTNLVRPLTGNVSLSLDDANQLKHHGIVTFAGGIPLYSNPDGDCAKGTKGVLLGAVGVSGDGVDQDHAVAKGAIIGAGYCVNP